MIGICEDLRKSVLQAAIQGRLTQQLPEDGDAETLYAEIQKEKQRLIKEGKIKKEKPLPEITDDDIPFDIPENWKWVKLPEIASTMLGKTLNRSTDKGELKPYLCSINVYWSGVNLETVKEARFDAHEQRQYRLQKNDILICEGGDVGRTIIWDRDSEMYYQNALHRVRFFGNYVLPEYFRSLMECYKGIGLIDECSSGMTIKHFVQGALNSIPIPLPPLAEQKRIVARVDELMKRIDEMEKTEKDITALYGAFPGDMKASLLQAAIQGKLTEQLASDGDAETLYADIQKEKQRLIKEGKIKKEKPLPEITEDDIPFDIPENWKWVRFGDCFDYHIGKTPPRKEPVYWKEEFPWVSIADMIDGDITQRTKEKVSDYAVSSTFSNRVSPAGTLIMSFKLTVGKVSILGMNAVHNEAIISIYPILNIDNIMRNYLFKILPFVANAGDTKNAIKGKTLNSESISNLLVPLPPLTEQKRIVEKLDQLLPLCDSMKEAIDATA